MDVAGWTMERRMRLPDWCFPNREIIGLRIKADVGTTWFHGISEIVLPDPCCIWSIGWYVWGSAAVDSRIRVGLSNVVPANEAAMNAVTEIFPYVWREQPGPDWIEYNVAASYPTIIPVRKGIEHGGLKLVAGFYIIGGTAALCMFVVVSGLPTEVSGYFNHTIP